MILKVWIR